MELQKWASDLNQKIYNDWKEQFSDWAAGFKVLYDEPGEADEEDLCGFSKAVDPRLGIEFRSAQ